METAIRHFRLIRLEMITERLRRFSCPKEVFKKGHVLKSQRQLTKQRKCALELRILERRLDLRQFAPWLGCFSLFTTEMLGIPTDFESSMDMPL
jgi:hypothetical protein